MAFNYFQNPYQIYNPYQQIQPSFQQQQNTQPMQIQNGGFVSVHNEAEARNYPIAPGNSVTFKDENAPYVYTKTQGFSQLDRPIFEKYRLVKEEDMQNAQDAPISDETSSRVSDTDYAQKSEIAALWGKIEALEERISKFEKTEAVKDE